MPDLFLLELHQKHPVAQNPDGDIGMGMFSQEEREPVGVDEETWTELLHLSPLHLSRKGSRKQTK